MIEYLETLKTGYYYWVLLALAAFGMISIGYWLAYTFFKKKKKKFLSLRDEMNEGYNGLLRAGAAMRQFNEVLNEAEGNSK